MRRIGRWEFTDRELAIVGFVAVAVCVRFFGVAHNPPGFYSDEASLSGHVACIARKGVDVYGHRWPLFSVTDPALDAAGEFGPFTMYPMVAWAKVFGISIMSMRSFNVVASLIAVVATAGFARNLLDRRAFWWALVLGVISPWSFQAGRVALGTVICLAYMMGGAWIFTRGRFERDVSRAEFLGAALLWGASLYYQRVILSVVFLGGVLVYAAWKRGRITPPAIAKMAGAGAVVALPLLLHTRGSANQGRAENVTILNSAWRAKHGAGSLLDLAQVFFENLGKHLSPSFLFFHGDANLRHGVGFVGQLSWPESALIVSLPVVGALLWKRRSAFIAKIQVLAIAAVCIVCGIIPAALTTPEELPHANRAIGSQPFFILLAVVAALLWQELKVPVVELAVAGTLVFGAFFIPRYFNDYPKAATGPFLSWIRNDAEAAARSGSMLDFLEKYRQWNPRSMFVYFSVANGGSCPSTRTNSSD